MKAQRMLAGELHGHDGESNNVGSAMHWPGGPGALIIEGTFAGAPLVSASLSLSDDVAPGLTYSMGIGPFFTAPGTYNFVAPAGVLAVGASVNADGDELTGLAITLVGTRSDQ